MRHDFAGTPHPTCAIRAMIATWRIKVDLPAILGPVIRQSDQHRRKDYSHWAQMHESRPA